MSLTIAAGAMATGESPWVKASVPDTEIIGRSLTAITDTDTRCGSLQLVLVDV